MSPATSVLSGKLKAMAFGSASKEPVLPLAGVLEEEFAALHPNDAAVEGAGPAIVADDIIDLWGMARALFGPWPALGEVVVRNDPSLEKRLRFVTTSPPEAEIPASDPIRIAVAVRLTTLIVETDLRTEPAFKPALDSIHAGDDGSFDDQPLADRNRRIVDAALAPFIRTRHDRRMASIIRRIHAKDHAALCLSGGGIRSASFAMGVIQGLARKGLLPRFHYLSTVSGGGYTGSWLSAWMARSGAARVHSLLRASAEGKRDAEPSTLRHIRRYSYYLTPRFTMMSADMWTLIATIARNVLLIWFVMLPVMMAGLMLPRLLVAGPMMTLRSWHQFRLDPGGVMVVLQVVGTLLTIIAISFVQRHLYSYSGKFESAQEHHQPATLHAFITKCLAPLIIGMVALAQSWEMTWSMIRIDPQDALRIRESLGGAELSQYEWAQRLIRLDPAKDFNPLTLAIVMGVAFWTFVYLAAWVTAVWGRRPRPGAAFLSAFCGALAGFIGAVSASELFGLQAWLHPPEMFATMAVPLSLFGLLVSKQIVVGLASRRMTDAGRESNARFSAWLLIAIVSWVGIAGVALYGPVLLEQFMKNASERLPQLLGLSSITGLVTSVLASSRQSTPSDSGGGGIAEALKKVAIAIAAPVFAVTVIVMISLLNQSMLTGICDPHSFWCPKPDPIIVERLFAGGRHPTHADIASPHLVLLLTAALFLVGYLFGRLISTNRFSLHAMYRVRLVRTFLGASKPPGQRNPDPFTGFDETDDMAMSELWPGKPVPPDDEKPPLHILNLTLNTVAGTDLATQSRMAVPFTVSPLHAGAAATGYRRTSSPDGKPHELYGAPDGMTLGTAMAISGAAASPNSGYHSSPTVTFLMTLFNARLGWWLGNPGAAGKRTFSDEEPRLALEPILDEMFGRTTDTAPYVYLSDGGHFENLGLYEMVRRRCRFIVVSDAGCDPQIAFDDLGGAIRKIRIDFGIPIDFGEGGIPVYSRDLSPRPADAQYWAIGRIGYSAVDGKGTDGVLLYLKPTFYGKEPYDVVNYGIGTPTFPHESTGNQFFGEAQFESYRALGSYVIDRMYEAERDRLDWLKPAGVTAPAAGYSSTTIPAPSPASR